MGKIGGAEVDQSFLTFRNRCPEHFNEYRGWGEGWVPMWNWCSTVGGDKYPVEEIKRYFMFWYNDILNEITSVTKKEIRIHVGKRLLLNFEHPIVFIITCYFKFQLLWIHFSKFISIFQIKKLPDFPILSLPLQMNLQINRRKRKSFDNLAEHKQRHFEGRNTTDGDENTRKYGSFM